jgi:hypothetical protein
MHYDLRTFPMDPEEIEARDGLSKADVPGVSERMRRQAREHNEEAPAPASADD